MTGTAVLRWDRPEKVMTTEQWQAISADSAPPGVWTPNMSKADMTTWKARKIGGRDPRVEIRKTACGTQVLIVVRPDSTSMSMNGTAVFTRQEQDELPLALAEAVAALREPA
jgi:hypothetical protein